MPIYEFECESCGADFEELVAAGTASVACRACGSAHTARRYSAQAATPRLVKSPGAARAQEGRNRQLKTRTKAAFKERRRAAREARGKGSARG